MAINNVPAVQSVIEQQNLLERIFQDPIKASLAYALIADRYVFPNGIGETITKTRPALFPLSAALTPINPATNTGLDNGLSDQYYTFEQYQIAINEYALSTTVNIKQDRTLLQRVFLQNVRALGENAARTIDGLCAQQIHTAYDSGNSWATTAATAGATTVKLDNVNGFDTAFSATNSPGLPTTVSGGNPMTVTVYTVGTGVLKGTISVTGVAYDGTNTSTALSGGVAYGRSGTLTFGAVAFNIVVGDQFVASDGSVIIRPNAKPTRTALAVTDVLTLQQLAQATATLRKRNVRPLPSGNYLCIIDPTIWPQLIADTAFEYATMGKIGEGYYQTGLVSRALGIEFVNSQMVPPFSTTTAGLKARHAVVVGDGVLIKGTFQGHIEAVSQGNTMDNGDLRMMAQDVAMITRGPLDRLQEIVTQTWNWVGGFVAPTDVTSTAAIIPTTDAARYKRAVVIEVGSAT